MTILLLTIHDKVINIPGTHVCWPKGIRSWKQFWISETGLEWPAMCCIYGCDSKAACGAHANVECMGNEEYIIPMCKSHHKTEWNNVKAWTEAVCVDREDTNGPAGTCYRQAGNVGRMTNLLLTTCIDDAVKNISGTSACKPRGFTSWKKFWCSKTGREWPATCSIDDCRATAADGAHVNVRHKEDEVYIIPMCKSHNSHHKKKWHKVNAGTVAVCVERGDTYGPDGTCCRQAGDAGRMTNLSLTTCIYDAVKNIPGTSACKPRGFTSWKKIWCSKTGREWPAKCSIDDCCKTAAVGVHVNVRRKGNEVYIIPMCKFQNLHHETEWHKVNAGTVAVCVEREDIYGSDGTCCRQAGDAGRTTNLLSTTCIYDKVRNIPGTHVSCPRGIESWKQFWISETVRKWPATCCIYGCDDKAVCGAHVNVMFMGNEEYIIPMCISHNKTEWHNAKAWTEAVCVDREDTNGPAGICYRRCQRENANYSGYCDSTESRFRFLYCFSTVARNGAINTSSR